MGNTYVWDLGFNFNAVQNQEGRSSIENGFVLVQTMTVNSLTKDAVPATPIGLSEGDLITFNLFNTTPLAPSDPGTGFSILSGTINFSSARVGQAIHSPFSTATISMNTSAPLNHGRSVIFDGIQAPEQAATQTDFPFWTVAGPLTVANLGRFQMSIELHVHGPSGARHFVIDPEMIVGSVG